MVEEAQFKLKKLLAELERIRGRHTELVTVYVPAGYSMSDIIGQLKSEQGTAENIKSKTTRKNVVDALEKAIQHLKLYKKTPDHGLAVFSGNVSEHEGVSDLKVWAVEPPDPLKVKLYWCDQVFRLEPLKEMVKEKEIYGLVVIDTNNATIGLLKGKSIKVLRRLDSIVPGKTGKGGQCLPAGTPVLTVDGHKPIEKVEDGEQLVVWDFKQNRATSSFCTAIARRRFRSALCITAKGHKIIASPDHLMFVALTEGGAAERAASELCIGDVLLAYDGKQSVEVPVTDITEIPTDNIDFYDLEVATHQNFIAAGILVHNSAQRFERVRAGLLGDWMKEVAEQLKELMPKDILGIVVGGPGPIKGKWLDEGYLPTDVKKKVLAVQDTGYADEHGLEELVERAKEVFAQASVAKERALVQKFLEHLMKNTGLVAYGINSVVDAIEKGAVDTILVSEEAPYVRLELEDQRDHGEKRFVRTEEADKQQTCKICGERMGVMGRMDVIDALKELAEQTGAAIEVISKDTREGEQLLALGGVAALLRYKL